MEKLTNLEEMIMKCIWDYGEEIPFLQIGKELKERYGKEYKRTSIRTYLFRLEDKGEEMPMFIRLFRKKNIEKKKQKIYWTIGLMDQQKNYLLH